ncbi:peptidase S8/S53 domain-containing protein [Phlyctochytrium arcticum]|nr:peptidase S8/S53 domain-containing protein [Phlyctochytrium arcticum]
MLGVQSIFALALTSVVVASPLFPRDISIPGEYIVGFRYPTNNLAPRNVTALIDEVTGQVTAHLAIERRDGADLQVFNRYDLGDGYYQGFAFKSNSPAVLASIQDHPEVAYVIPNIVIPERQDESLDRPVEAPTDSVPVDAQLWNLDVIDGTRDSTFNFDSSAGAGVDVYIVDSGVDIKHTEFEGRIKWAYPEGGRPRSEHGTHVAGIAAGKTFGIARKANILAVEYGGTMDKAIVALQWMLNQIKGKGKPTVANFSWGIYRENKPLTDATRALVDADMAISIAAGNERKESCLSVPSNTPGVINVASSNKNDEFDTDYSDFGKCVQIIAPGTGILSAKLGGGSRLMTGTSMAAPHVAGALAVVLSSGKATSAQGAIQYLIATAAKDKLKKVPSNNVNLFLNI